MVSVVVGVVSVEVGAASVEVGVVSVVVGGGLGVVVGPDVDPEDS